MRAVAALAAILMLSVLSPAKADVGLVEACVAPDSAGLRSGQCPFGQRSWLRPQSGLNILSCGSVSVGDQCTWGHSEFRYRPWDDIRDEALVQTCAADIEPGPFGSVDPCGTGGHSAGKPRIPKRDVITTIEGRASVLLTWEHPTKRIDGTDLDISEIANTMLMWGPSDDTGVLAAAPTDRTAIVPAPATSAEVSVEPGETYFAARTIDTEGLMSGLSNVAFKSVAIDPQAPGGVWADQITGPMAVGEDTDAYAFVPSRDTITLVWVGSVPSGTPCDPLQGVNGLYIVPRAAVNLDIDGDGSDDSSPEAVVARCSAN